MNAVEIEEAVSKLASQPFDAAEFPFAFLEAFGNKETTLKRLRKGDSNKSDFAGPWGGVLQTNNIHIAVTAPGAVTGTLAALKASPATARAKAKYVLATDGDTFEAEDLATGEIVACAYADFPNHFGFFLPLAGITTVKQIRDSAFDIRATGRLNRLYVELLKDNPAWGTDARRHDMNHFMARLIFCFFAEDTGIFNGGALFTTTISQFSEPGSGNTDWVISEIFRAMNTKLADRPASGLRNWANAFPYVNGGLFSGDTDVPRFSKIARSYLLHIGSLDWTKINPDIFGSMIQAVADEGERSALGMHYTSVPNILKVLNPLFLDDLRAQLEEAGDNPRKLLNLRNRMAKIRVFDPACGSGNFLVIAYKEMRAIEAEINKLRGEADAKTAIPKTNFRGIELRDFAAEIARLALIIAEFQCDVTYRGEVQARAEFLPLDRRNWITQGNALRLDWLSICPPTGTGVKMRSNDLFDTPLDQAEIDFDNVGGETYICGNPPYRGSKYQTPDQKRDLKLVFEGSGVGWKSLDYVAGWLWKGHVYSRHSKSSQAFVATNSICQGVQIPELWPHLLSEHNRISFAWTSFRWANLAANKAGVTVVIVGLSDSPGGKARLFSENPDGTHSFRDVENINAYLIAGPNVIVKKRAGRADTLMNMDFGNKAVDGGHLYLNRDELVLFEKERQLGLVRRVFGADELVYGLERYCFWIPDSAVNTARENPLVAHRLDAVRDMRLASNKAPTRRGAQSPHKFEERRQGGSERIIALPRITSEGRDFLPVGVLEAGTIVSSQLFSLYDAESFYIALLSSRLHWVWMATVCGRLEMRFSYSNTLGWNTFPVPTLTEKNKADLTTCAEDILLAREAHFPATIADLYDPEKMPANLRAAHDRNDEVLERIYIGRRFKNDTERLEKLFEMYTRMSASVTVTKKRKSASGKKKAATSGEPKRRKSASSSRSKRK